MPACARTSACSATCSGACSSSRRGRRCSTSSSGSARSRAGRAAAGEREPLEETIAALPLERQAVVLRAFGVFFQLANIAEQHHRLRRRRAYEHEGRVPRESLEAAFARLDAAGVGEEELAREAEGVRVELVFTAHPTEATRRTVLQAHQRIAALLRELDDPELPPSRRARVEDALAEEITILWQTDEVRSRRPGVYDEIRHGLWFFERSLWQAAPALLRAYRRRLPDAPVPLSFGTWIGGDLDGNPNAGPQTVEAALEQARSLAARLYRDEVRALARRWGMSSTIVEYDRRPRREADRRPVRPERRRAVSPPAELALGSARRRRLRVDRRPAGRARPDRPEPARARRRARRGRRPRGSPHAASRSSASTWPSSTCASTRARSGSRTSACSRRCARAPASSAGTGLGALDR